MSFMRLNRSMPKSNDSRNVWTRIKEEPVSMAAVHSISLAAQRMPTCLM